MKLRPKKKLFLFRLIAVSTCYPRAIYEQKAEALLTFSTWFNDLFMRLKKLAAYVNMIIKIISRFIFSVISLIKIRDESIVTRYILMLYVY